MTRRMRLTLLGTGSSGGVPRVGNDWGACDPAEPKNRRMRCSALLDTWQSADPDQRTRILIDTSPDFREQALAHNIQHLDAILFTHDHADQTHGIDDVRALAIRARKQIPAYLDAPTRASLLPKFRYCFEGFGGYPPIVDLQPDLTDFQAITISGGGGSAEILPLPQRHGRIKSLGFRVGGLAYCNDVDGLGEDTLNALHGLDLLVMDALRYRPHPSHAHVDLALEWIAALAPKRAVLTNLHVDLDYQTLRRELPDNVEPAFDGWSAELAL
ncbi:MAG: MBL fold metallo-hydrolase [Pseudomonadota bacterium]